MGEKHAGGRPTKYDAEYATPEFMEAFLADCEAKKKLISLCGFAVYVKVTEDTLANWGEKHEEFFGVLGQIRQASKDMLINNGLDSTYNSTITKLMLSSNHGMKERTAGEMNHSGEVILKPPVIE